MRVIDPGHQYALSRLDGLGEELLTYVKREGDKYPGNRGHHSGTNLQEEWRAQIDRLKYLNRQDPHDGNWLVIENLRESIAILERRAAQRHGRDEPEELHAVEIELLPFCGKCGHIGCGGKCEQG